MSQELYDKAVFVREFHGLDGKESSLVSYIKKYTIFGEEIDWVGTKFQLLIWKAKIHNTHYQTTRKALSALQRGEGINKRLDYLEGQNSAFNQHRGTGHVSRFIGG